MVRLKQWNVTNMTELKVLSANLNGIRAARRKGFFEWVAQQNVDVICVQETKAQTKLLTTEQLELPGYQYFFADAERPGYSGVGIYSRLPVTNVKNTIGWEPLDREGRFVQVDIDNYSIVSLYLPSGTTGDIRQTVKYQLMDYFYDNFLIPHANDGRDWIICGDWNIAHQPIDLKNWRANQKNSGFLPEERAWLDKVFAAGWVDSFRAVNREEGQYSWWTYRGGARARNVGWRIDYQIVSPGLAQRVKAAHIDTELVFSDHAALIHGYTD